MTTDQIYQFIQMNKLAVLATVTPENTSESACMGIAVTPDLKIIFDTVTTSRKYQNLLVNPSISFVIGLDNEQTIQYEGIAKIPTESELVELLKIYFKTFPDGQYRKDTWEDIAYFYVEPTWIRYSDFNSITPHIEEFKF